MRCGVKWLLNIFLPIALSNASAIPMYCSKRSANLFSFPDNIAFLPSERKAADVSFKNFAFDSFLLNFINHVFAESKDFNKLISIFCIGLDFRQQKDPQWLNLSYLCG